MSKKTPTNDSRQLSLFDLVQRAQARTDSPAPVGSLNIEVALCQALADAVKRCPLSVHQIAGEMSHHLGETITAEMIYSWTACSKNQHQIWGSRLGIFCRVTGSRRPLEIVNDSAGYFCLPGPEALRAEIQHLREEEHKAAKERRKREMFLTEMEGGK